MHRLNLAQSMLAWIGRLLLVPETTPNLRLARPWKLEGKQIELSVWPISKDIGEPLVCARMREMTYGQKNFVLLREEVLHSMRLVLRSLRFKKTSLSGFFELLLSREKSFWLTWLPWAQSRWVALQSPCFF